MKKNYLQIIFVILLFAYNGLHAQHKATYTIDEQIKLDSIKQSYLDIGIPNEWAERRAKDIFENLRKSNARTAVYGPSPVAGSIWLDRDSVTGAANASHAHNFTPEEFIKDIFVKGGREIADQAIRNVTLISSTWNGSVTDTWNNKGYMGPFGGDAGTWSSDDRELLYFDHGDTTTMVDTWDNMGQVKYFGIDKGFLLSTGPGLLAEGDNTSSGSLSGGYNDWTELGGGTNPPSNQRDPDLSPIAASQGQNLGTITSLEFDFRSFSDSVTFEFIFASEEFKNFSNSSYNDVFGFFVSGPGLSDEWGNSGDTINIARYPDSTPISVNASNWGYRSGNSFSDYDPFGPTPVRLTPHYPGIGGDPGGSENAIRPEYHVPVFDDQNEWLMEYNGHSIVLTAKAKLQRGVWYHLKLAIGNVSDSSLGSGVFLKAGSLDLGAPESDVPRPYVKSEFDSIFGWQSLYANCDNTLELTFDKSASDRNIYVWSEGSGADFVYDPGLNQYFNDSIKYVLPANDSSLVINFNVNNQVENGSQVWFYSMFEGSFSKDTSEIFNLYAKSKTEVIKYIKPTAYYKGILDIQTSNGSPYIQRSVDGGLTWEFARDTLTGEATPYKDYQISNLSSDENAFIIFREPNTCFEYDTIFLHKEIGGPNIMRVVVMPDIPGAIVDKVSGEYTINSREDFIFTITPTGNNANLALTITTSRTSVPDSEGVIIVKNADGSYTVTIRQVQEHIEIYADFVTSNETLGNNKIWANANLLYIRTNQNKFAQIYSISGAMIQSIDISAGETVSIPLNKGFYIVAIDELTYKIIVK